MSLVSDAARPRLPNHRNNFDLLRLCFASLVYLGHYLWIFPTSPEVARILFRVIGDDGQRCVQGFFVISGYLMVQSYARSSSLLIYFEKRFRRIYPAYLVVIIGSVVLGSFLTYLPIEQYISTYLLKYLCANLVFLNFIHPFLPGVFTDQPIHYVNGPLWTLKIEVSFYLLLPLMFWARRFCKFPLQCCILYILSVAYHIIFQQLGRSTGMQIYHILASQLPGQLCYFMGGALVASCRDYLARHPATCAVLSLVCLIGSASGAFILYPIALAVIVLSVGLLVPQLIELAKHGDLSYGVYIIHFPLLQSIQSIGLLQEHPAIRFITASAGVFYLSYLMWHFVEAPALRGRWTKRPAPSIAAISQG